MDLLIDPETLHNKITNPRTKIVEASWDLSGHGYENDFLKSALPGAVFYDMATFSDKASHFPHKRLGAADFDTAIGRLGISFDDEIIVYDRTGLFSAPRCAWNLRSMGAKSVAILNGGFQSWEERFPTEPGNSSPSLTAFHAHEIDGFWIDIDHLKNIYHCPEVCILDARSKDRFDAKMLETRPNTRSGHIPGSRSLHFSQFINNGFYRKKEEIIKILGNHLNPWHQSIITTCGSGVTAAIIATAIEISGLGMPQIFDGSWAEWGHKDSGLPVAIL